MHIFKISQTLYAHLQDQKISSDTLITSIQKTLRYIPTFIQEFWSTRLLPGDDRVDLDTRLEGKVKATAVVFDMCIKSLTHLCRDITGRRSKGKVIFALVEFFNTILATITANCVAVTCPTKNPLQNKNSRNANGPDNTPKLDHHPHTIIPSLAKLLVLILTSPDLINPQIFNAEVIEGFLASLLNRLGVLMARAIYDDGMFRAHVEDEIPIDERPEFTSSQQVAIQLEGHYLAEVVARVLKDNKMHKSSLLITKLSGSKEANGKEEKEKLLGPARKRLQKTLMETVFGAGGKDFVGALKMPVAGAEFRDSPMPNFEIEGTEGHIPGFVASLWDSVGWDLILSPV